MEGGSRSTIVIWLVAAGLAAIAAFRLVGSDSAAPPVRIDGPATPGRASTTTSSHAGNEEALYVHVAGAVRRPGLIRVPSGTRVATALERAGGPTRRADLTLVNLAARLQDGQQIVVPDWRAATAAASPGAAAGPAGGKVHLSSATVEQLDGVGGIGPTLAQRIVEYRDSHGGFRSLAELAQVEGIGEKRLKTLRDALQP